MTFSLLFRSLFFQWLFALLIIRAVHLEAYETTIASDEARYDGEQITLTGHVCVDNAMGKVTAQEAVLYKDDKKISSIDFPWIELKRDICLTLSKGGALTCEELFLDYTEKTSFFSGKPQVIYKDEIGEVYADRAQVDYVEVQGVLKASKIALYDHIRLVNLGTEEEPAGQYALADEVLYYPEEGRLLLNGRDHPVLFYDQMRDVQLCARSVCAHRDPVTKKESVQGIGEVRFLFKQEELEKIKNRFQIQ